MLPRHKSRFDFLQMQQHKSLNQLTTPYYLIEEAKLLRNLKILKYLQEKANINILFSLKSFANSTLLPVISQYLQGGSASSLYEAIMVNAFFRKKAHTYSPAFTAKEFEQISELSNYIVFNSITQYETYYPKCVAKKINIGLRINPEYSEIESRLYNPAIPGSRFGITKDKMPKQLPEFVNGLHFHSLSENNHVTAENVINKTIEHFDEQLRQVTWLNIGGGYLVTGEDFDIEAFIRIIQKLKLKFPHIRLFMEPGEAIIFKTGILAASVIDIVINKGIVNAILDISFRNHAPYYVFMPRSPIIRNIPESKDGKHKYQLAGSSCMTGDYISNKIYSFDSPLKIGDKLIFEDMIHYTIVDSTMFNGINMPDIVYLKEDGSIDHLKTYTYEDFTSRLG